MKKYSVIFIGLALVAGTLAITANAEESNSATAGIAKAIAPIVKGIKDADLRQSLSIQEIQGRVICRELNACPLSEAKASTEVLIKAAKVTEVGSGYLKISIFGYNYKIDTTAAKMVRYSWGESNVDEISVGDIVNVAGYLDASDSYLVHAQTVRNVSIQKVVNVFKGAIASINASSTTFVLQTEERGNQTVVVSGDTKIILEGGSVTCIKAPCPMMPVKVGSFSDLQVGMKVIVRGIWDKTNSTIQAQLITIGGDNDVRPFFQKIGGQIEKFTEKLESKIEKSAGSSADAIRNKIEELQKKIADILNALKTATSTNQ